MQFREKLIFHFSFIPGVTIWEILTYGGKPYEHVAARDLPELVLKGGRLSQPDICSLELYKVILSCWWLDPTNRATFKELADEFAKMAQDPGRYLAEKVRALINVYRVDARNSHFN